MVAIAILGALAAAAAVVIALNFSSGEKKIERRTGPVRLGARARKQQVTEAIKLVAKRLGNTPATCRKH